MKIIIAGGRDFNDYEFLKSCCDGVIGNRVVEIVSGRCRGADQLGEKYAYQRGFKISYFPANWKEFGKVAGFIRNEEMAKYSNGLICFWDKKSKGTKNMIDLAHKYELKVRIFEY